MTAYEGIGYAAFGFLIGRVVIALVRWDRRKRLEHEARRGDMRHGSPKRGE